jgi:ABC-type transport system involved in multi-copper enzyme maturation permease subunit
MTAFSSAGTVPATQAPGVTRISLGFGTLLRKEIMDWARSRRALIVGVSTTALAVLTSVIPVLMGPTEDGKPLSLDPTVNVLLGWNGQMLQVIVILATMSLITGERDRGTLAWSLTHPLARIALLAAKWAAAVLVLAVVGIALPLTASSAVATIAYGAPPDLGHVATFGLLYISVPMLYAGLTIAIAAVIPSTAGVAGIAFLVAFMPSIIAGFLPSVTEYVPTSIAVWVGAITAGIQAPVTIPLAWAASLVVLAALAALAFDRQEP